MERLAQTGCSESICRVSYGFWQRQAAMRIFVGCLAAFGTDRLQDFPISCHNIYRVWHRQTVRFLRFLSQYLQSIMLYSSVLDRCIFCMRQPIPRREHRFSSKTNTLWISWAVHANVPFCLILTILNISPRVTEGLSASHRTFGSVTSSRSATEGFI